LLLFSPELYVVSSANNVKIRLYKTIILPVVLYRSETWSLTLKDEHRLRMLEKRVLRRIFGPKRNEMRRSWKNLHNEELHNLYSSPSVIIMLKSRRMRWAGHVARKEKKRKVYRISVGKPEGARPLGRPRCRWEDNIKMDLREIEWRGMDWIDLARDKNQWRALVITVMNLLVP
jgi:hypothetical protein